MQGVWAQGWSMGCASMGKYGVCLLGRVWGVPPWGSMEHAFLGECLLGGVWGVPPWGSMGRASLGEHGVCLHGGAWGVLPWGSMGCENRRGVALRNLYIGHPSARTTIASPCITKDDNQHLMVYNVELTIRK